MLSFVCNPSWFAPNISLRRMSPTCVFICECSRVFVLFQASAFLHVWSSGSIAQTSLCCCRPYLHSLVLIALLLPLPCGFYTVYITEHISKYNSFEKYIRLCFQRVLIYLNRSPYERVMVVSLQLACCPEIFRKCNHRWFVHIRL
jgi:hypothetical protein